MNTTKIFILIFFLGAVLAVATQPKRKLQSCPFGGCHNETNTTKNLECPPNCKNCSFDSSRNASLCSECLDGFTLNLTSLSCQSCSPNCSLCHIEQKNISNKTQENLICDKCQANFTYDLKTQKCLPECQQGSYFNPISNACESCPKNCTHCYFNTISNKALCHPFDCKENYAYDSASRLCLLCEGNSFYSYLISECSPCLIENCTQCSMNPNNYRVTCDQCVSGYSPDSATSNTSCLKCPSNLLSCPTSTNCQTICPEGYALDLENNCIKCSDGCHSCYWNETTNSTNCYNDGCQAGYEYFRNSCIPTCKNSSFYYSFLYNQCVSCPDLCSRCTLNYTNQSNNNPICLECINNSTLDNKTGLCIPNCSNGSYYHPSVGCKSCDYLNCTECFFNQSKNSPQCRSSQCKDSYYYVEAEQRCFVNLTDCQNKFGYYYSESKNLCQKCPKYCDSCVDYDFKIFKVFCTHCTSGHVDYNSGLCIPDCSNSSYYNFETEMCEPCPNGCDSCRYSYESFSNYSNYLTLECVNCKRGFGRDSNECIKCANHCVSCGISLAHSSNDSNGTNNTNDTNNYTINRSLVCYECENNYDKNSLGECAYCPIGNFLNQNDECIPCQVSNCTKCMSYRNYSQGLCLQCEPGYILNNFFNLCEPDCKSNYTHTNQSNYNLSSNFYYDPIENNCKQCPYACDSCSYNYITKNISCSQCIRGFSLNIYNTCISCPDYGGFTYSREKNKCLSCEEQNPHCNLCYKVFYSNYTEVSYCISCFPPYENENYKCVLKCKENEFFSPLTESCEICPNNTKCYYDNHTNRSISYSCLEGFYNNSMTEKCEPCHEKCSSCFWNQTLQTLRCSRCNYEDSYFYDNDTQDCVKCPIDQGYYISSRSHSCLKCPENCTFCEQSYWWDSSVQCTSCSNGSILNPFSRVCEPSCGFFSYYSNNTKRCEYCPDNCARCFSEETSGRTACLECEAGFFNVSNYSNVNQSSICKSCPDHCLTCDNNYDNGKSCKFCEFGFWGQYSSDPCEETCEAHHYYNPIHEKCLPCDDNCYSCAWRSEMNASVCLSCKENFHKNYNTGLCEFCPHGYEFIENVCLKCPDNCKACYSYQTYNNTMRTYCEICEDNFSLDFNKYPYECIPACENGSYYSPSTEKCEKCPVENTICKLGYNDEVITTNCTGVNYTLNQFTNSCVYCPSSGYYFNEFNQSCEPCPENCKECAFSRVFGRVLCSECKANYTLDKFYGSCAAKCLDAEYYSSFYHQCKKCENNCIKCSEGLKCEKCETGFRLIDNSSCISCSIGYYSLENNVCVKCPWEHSLCKNTTSTLNLNLRKFSVYKTYSLPRVGNVSLSGCIDGYGMDLLDNFKCKPCPENCSSCYHNIIFGVSFCESCNQNHTFDIYYGKCIHCNQGYYYDEHVHECRKCGNFCNICEWDILRNNSKCLECQENYQTYNESMGNCQKCPMGYNYNNTLGKCEKISCIEGNSFNNKTYLCDYYDRLNCSVGSYYNNWTKKCESCWIGYIFNNITMECEYQNQSKSNTSNCSYGYYYNFTSGRCQNYTNHTDINCSKGYYYNNETQRCESCLNDMNNKNCQTNNNNNTNGSNSTFCPLGYRYNISSQRCEQYNISCHYRSYYNPFYENCTDCPQNCSLYCQFNFSTEKVNCIYCSANYTFYSEINSCLADCPAGYYNSLENLNCSPCNISNCEKCSVSYNKSNDSKNATCDICAKGFALSYNRKACTPCLDNCAACSSSNYCYECFPGNILINNTCKACPKGCDYCYFDYSKANISCRYYGCSSNYEYVGDICVPKCSNDSTSYYSFVSNSCVPCNSSNRSCLRCVSNWKDQQSDEPLCTYCANGYELNQLDQCIKSCPYGYYFDERNNSNNSNCTRCPQNCTSCYFNYYLSEPMCRSYHCSYNYFYDYSIDRCMLDCDLYNTSNYSNSSNSSSNSSIAYYYSYSEHNCLECPINCTSCYYYSYANNEWNVTCSSCRNGSSIDYSYKTGLCLPNCSNGFYFDYNKSACLSCPENCSQCSYKISEKMVKCDICNKGYGVNLLGFCEPCGENCTTCHDQRFYDFYLGYLYASVCTECENNLTADSQGHCKWCPDGYFLNRTMDECSKCLIEDCEKCSDITNLYYPNDFEISCSQCFSGFSFNNNAKICQLDCFGTYFDYDYYPSYYDPLKKSCEVCPYNCSSCNYDNSTGVRCNSCRSGFFGGYNNNCSYCPYEGPYVFSYKEQKCIDCEQKISNCTDCAGDEGSYRCYHCYPPYIPNNNYTECILSCSSGYYYSPYTKECIKCPVENSECYWSEENMTVIWYCPNNWVKDINNESCFQCSSGSYYNTSQKKCLECPENCSNCYWSSYYNRNLCYSDSCNTNYSFHYYSGECRYCPEKGFYFNYYDGCFECSQDCDSCYFSYYNYETICRKCSDNFILNTVTNKCEIKCEEGKYYSNMTNSCESCPENCSECFYNPFNKSVNCSQCKPGYYNNQSENYSNNTNISYTSSDKCVLCPENCIYCKFDTYSKQPVCGLCHYGYTMNYGLRECVPECNKSHYFSPKTKKCEKCDLNCEECKWNSSKNSSDCLKCSKNYQNSYENRTCSFCPNKGFTYYNQTCYKCSEGCSSCSKSLNYSDGSLIEYCNKCFNNYTFNYYQGYPYRCYPKCPNGTYYSSASKSCLSCPIENSNCVEVKYSNGTNIKDLGCIGNSSYDAFYNKCISCPKDSYYSKIQGKCEKCHPSCTDGCYFDEYYGKSICLCDNKTSIFDVILKTCHPLCQRGEFYSYYYHECKKCPVNCEDCSDQNNAYYFYYDYPPSYYYMHEPYCLECSPNFEKRMIGGNSSCYPKCEEASYYSIINKKCMKCPWNHSICIELTYKTQQSYCDINRCRLFKGNSNLYRVGCHTGYGIDYMNNFECTLCPENCSSCEINYIPGVTQCSSCFKDSEFDEKYRRCVPGCDNESYYGQEEHSCKKCDSNCKKCKWNNRTDAAECLACSEGFYLSDYDDYEDSNTCINCSQSLPNCKKCDTNTVCTECISDSFELDPLTKQCKEIECQEGYYLQSNTCKLCNETCLSCSGPNDTNCITCESNLKLVQGRCLNDDTFSKIINSTNISNINSIDSLIKYAEFIYLYYSFSSSTNSNNECNYNTSSCFNNGTCNSSNNRCVCSKGFFGIHCEFNEKITELASEIVYDLLDKFIDYLCIHNSSNITDKISQALTLLTKIKEIQSEETISKSFELIEKLISITEDQKISLNLVSTISNILEIMTSNFNGTSNHSKKIEKAIDSLDLIISFLRAFKVNDTEIDLKSDNVHVISMKIDTSNKTALREGLQKKFSRGNSSNDTQDTNSSELSVTDEFLEKLAEIQGTSITKTEWKINIHQKSDNETKIASNIVSIEVKNQNNSKCNVSNLSSAIEITIVLRTASEGKKYQCKYFNHETGKWEYDGVTTEDSNNTNNGTMKKIKCKSHHLTDFAVVEVDISIPNRKDPSDKEIYPSWDKNNGIFACVILFGSFIFCCLVVWIYHYYSQRKLTMIHEKISHTDLPVQQEDNNNRNVFSRPSSNEIIQEKSETHLSISPIYSILRSTTIEESTKKLALFSLYLMGISMFMAIIYSYPGSKVLTHQNLFVASLALALILAIILKYITGTAAYVISLLSSKKKRNIIFWTMFIMLYCIYGGILSWRMAFVNSENTKKWIYSILIVFGVDAVLLDGLFILLTRIWKSELLAKVMKMSGF